MGVGLFVDEEKHRWPGGTLHPLRGVWHLLSHCGLWKYTLLPVVCGVAISVVLFVFVWSIAFGWQRSLLGGYLPSAVAWLVTIALCLAEVAISTFVLLQAALGGQMERVFEQAMRNRLEAEGREEVWEAMERRLETRESPFWKKTSGAIWWAVVQLVLGTLTLPLHLIPVIGTLLAFSVNGGLFALETHELYFEMIDDNPQRLAETLKYHAMDYMKFGCVAQLMLMVPGFGAVAFVSNAAGAALWAADIEISRRPDGSGGNAHAAENPERTDNAVAAPRVLTREAAAWRSEPSQVLGTDNPIAAPRPVISADCEPERYDAIYDELDTDGNGLISQGEFTVAIAGLGLQVTHEYIAGVWHVYDIDGNGELDREEFSRMMTILKTKSDVTVALDQKETTVDEAAQGGGSSGSQEWFEDMQPYQLKAECKKRGLPDTGDRDEMLAHLELFTDPAEDV
jgi:uncharacterized protein involved in cysteine biosynthesis